MASDDSAGVVPAETGYEYWLEAAVSRTVRGTSETCEVCGSDVSARLSAVGVAGVGGVVMTVGIALAYCDGGDSGEDWDGIDTRGGK